MLTWSPWNQRLASSFHRRGVKPRVLWRLVYLASVVAGWGWPMVCWSTLLVSGTRATSCSVGVRVPVAEYAPGQRDQPLPFPLPDEHSQGVQG